MRRYLSLLAPCAALVACFPIHAQEPFDYFTNSWNVIGLKDYRDGTRLSPTNELLLSGKRRVRIRVGRQLTPLGREHTKTLLDGWLPIVLVSVNDQGIRYDVTLWATPLPTMEHWRAAFDWPAETENFLNWVAVKATNAGSGPAEANVQIDEVGAATSALASATWRLLSGEARECVARVPFAPVEGEAPFAGADSKLWLSRTKDYWRSVMKPAARIAVPCPKSRQALLAAHVCQLLANDHGELRGGEGFYDQFYIRDGGYQLMELEEAGLWEAARKAVGCYLKRQRPDGRFETQANQFDANGQALWVLWQYWKITGDSEWLASVYPQMVKAVAWIRQARRKAPPDSPFAGLLPNAVADGEYLWDGKHHIVGYDLWNLRGMLCTADAASALGKSAEAQALHEEAWDYRADIDVAWAHTSVDYFPPSWEEAGTHWGNTETLWPTELFAREDARVSALINHARHEHGGGFAEGTLRWLGHSGAIHPYLSAYTTMASLARGDHAQVVEDFYWYLLHSTATHAFPEGIYYRRRFAWSSTIPHVTGASNFALLLRHMLVHERGDELHLLSAVPDWWLEEGEEIRVERMPTHFGELSFTARGTAGGVEVKLEPPRRNPPRRIVLHLPRSRPLVRALDGVEVVVRADQAKRWDFPTVVKLYRETAPAVKPIPGLVKLPLRDALDGESWTFLDLAPHANTDPFTAPFGVPNPGKYLFTGMPVGEQTVGGVPFRILDPSANNGRGFVVLHSPKGPATTDWPTQVEIPVGQQAKRAFFLGNVHGWGSNDDGAGEWGSVAEYVIHYADRTTQTVPLITGRTAEDWTHQPEATDAYCGLQGEPWHLNALGVEVRPAVIDRIVFRDQGTIAAPVLVAVTLEK